MPAVKLFVRGTRGARLATVLAAGTTLGAVALGVAALGDGAHASATDRAEAASVAASAAIAPRTVPAPSASTVTVAPATPTAAAAPLPAGAPAARPTPTATASTTPSGVPSAEAKVVSGPLVAPSASAPVGLPVGIQLQLPAAGLTIGGSPVEFSVLLTNHTGKAYSSLNPMFQLVPASGVDLKGTLQEFDPAARAWRTVPLPDIGTAPVGAAGDTPFTLPANGSLTIRYRLGLAPNQQVQPTDALFYAIGADGHQLGFTSAAARLTAG
ncbi:hypothetical protein CFP65_7423 [Kitasatospora sp. MMS16-BH015]|uniref:hypothetical protein n=1 Tax=Kitasatospora sp. MMS16-BH015 TaxID=2018025 RepID=UPI000CA2740B|nr:hypothetical protein [Kitasatospora sp. MMS16-BH015]AUG82004.1 hypothetical protein CFP65_7423 [Kitasatospora sp. MMS16-BH015]